MTAEQQQHNINRAGDTYWTAWSQPATSHITCENRLSMSAIFVVACSSVDLNPAHACAGVGHGVFLTEVIGDFPKDKARNFFIGHALPRKGREVELSEGDWSKIWEVGGTHVRVKLPIYMLAVCVYAGLDFVHKGKACIGPAQDDTSSAFCCEGERISHACVHAGLRRECRSASAGSLCLQRRLGCGYASLPPSVPTRCRAIITHDVLLPHHCRCCSVAGGLHPTVYQGADWLGWRRGMDASTVQCHCSSHPELLSPGCARIQSHSQHQKAALQALVQAKLLSYQPKSGGIPKLPP